ncbi:MAG: sugar kinase [Microbacterium sp.]
MNDTQIDVLAIGEPLALIDPIESGPLERVDSFKMRVAGAEMNALIGLARLGHSTAFVSAVGDDPFGRLVRRSLQSEGIDTSFVHTGRAHTGVFFKERLGAHGRRVYYYRDRSAASKTRPGSAIKALDHFRPRIALMSGLTLGLGTGDGLGSAAETMIHEAHRRGCTVVFDANLRPGIWHGETAREQFASVAGHLDHLLAGESELATLSADADVERSVAELLALGLSSVVVKYGREGSTVHTAAGSTSIRPHVVEAVDSIGAGDAFAAGFTSGLLRGWSPNSAARLGSAMGAHAVAGTGDWESLPTGENARQLVANAESVIA